MVCRVTNNLEESNTADFNKRTMGTIFQTNTKHRPSPAKGHARSPGARVRRPPLPTPACGARGPGAQRSAPPTSASSGGEAEPPRAATCLALRRRACAAGHRALPALARPPPAPAPGNARGSLAPAAASSRCKRKKRRRPREKKSHRSRSAPGRRVPVPPRSAAARRAEFPRRGHRLLWR